MLKVTESIPPEYCSFERLEKLKEAGLKTDGHIDHLKEIIAEKGCLLPQEHEGHYGFIYKGYTRLYLTLVDSYAELILMIVNNYPDKLGD